MLDTFPVYMSFTRGLVHDSKELHQHIMTLKQIGANVDEYYLDAGYDSIHIHADIWYHLGAHPYIQFGPRAICHQEGSIRRIDHWVNKYWKNGGNVHDSLSSKLKFLFEHNRCEQVGRYIRNTNIANPDFHSYYSKRNACERIHDHIKDTVKFDVRGIRNLSKPLYAFVNFVVYQCLILTNLHRGAMPMNSFAKYY